MSKMKCSVTRELTFWRIVDVPFETCVAAFETWLRGGQDRGHQIGRSRLIGPSIAAQCGAAVRIEVRLSRGRLRPALRMRLDIDRWARSPSRTALELFPDQRVRPTAAYFRAGHHLLDALTQSLRQPS